MLFNFTTFKENEVVYHVDVDTTKNAPGFEGRKIVSDHGSYIKQKPVVEYQISLQPEHSTAEKRKLIHFEGQNDDQKVNKRRPMAEIQNQSENQMSIFEDKNVAADWFSAWTTENRAQQVNHQEVVENHQVILGREQFMRAKEIQLRARDQDIIKKSVEAQIKTSNDVMAMLQRFESRLYENSNKTENNSNELIAEANEMIEESTEN